MDLHEGNICDYTQIVGIVLIIESTLDDVGLTAPVCSNLRRREIPHKWMKPSDRLGWHNQRSAHVMFPDRSRLVVNQAYEHEPS